MKYYHAWFQTKFKRFILIDGIDIRVHELLKQISEEKRITLIASGSLPDHMHLLIGLENHQELSWAVHMFKGVSSRALFQEFPLLKLQFKTNNLWARRFNAKEVHEEALDSTKKYVLAQKKDLYVI